MNDPRIYEINVVVADDGNRLSLSPEEVRAVIDAFETVRFEATKWRLLTQQTGRLVITDAPLASEIRAFLRTTPSDPKLPATT